MNQIKQTEDNHIQISDFNEESISFGDIALVLTRHLKIIIIFPSILCFVTIIYTLFIAKPIYVSTSKIISSSGSGGGTSEAFGIAAQFGISLPSTQSEQKWVYPEIIKSRSLAKAVLKQKFDTYEFGLQKSLLQILTYGNSNPEHKLDTLETIAVKKLLDMVNVSEDIKTAIITLNINANDPRLASDINQAFIDQLDAHQKKYNKSKTSNARKFIQGRILDTEKDLVAAEENLKVFKDRNRRIENSPSLQLDRQRLEREVTVLTGVFTTLKQQLETTKIEEVKDSDYVIILDPPNVPLEKSKPKKKLLVILAGIFGISLGIPMAFLKEYSSKKDKIERKKLLESKSLLKKNISSLIPKLFKNI